MDTDHAYNCPECEAILEEEELTSCPTCEADIVFCSRRDHYVLKSQYNEGVKMCEECWKETVDQ